MKHNATLSPVYSLGSMPPAMAAAVSFLARYQDPTLSQYKYHLNQWFAWCEHQQVEPLHEVKRGHVELYIHELLADHKPSTVCTAMNPVRGFYKFACIDGLIVGDPAAHARLPKVHYTKRPFVDRPDLKHFLATAKATTPRHWAGSQLLCVMGLRASEACSLTVQQALHVERGMRVLYFTRKGGGQGVLAIPYQSVQAIDAQIAGRTEGPLLTTLKGEPLTRHALYGLMMTVGNRAGFRMNPHYLRAMGGTTILDSGGSILEAQEFLGHADARTTQRHYNLMQTDVASHPVHLVGAKLAV